MVRFHEIIKVQIIQFSESDVISANVQNISLLVLFAVFLLVLWRKNLLQSLKVFSNIFHELMNLLSFEWLNCILT